MRNIKFIGAFVIILMISLASCAPTRSNTVVVRNQPKVVVVKQPRVSRGNRIIVVNPRGHHRNNRVIVVRR